jgi:pyrimidine operon attenuation protein/uracil phosphoribosyltransferase
MALIMNQAQMAAALDQMAQQIAHAAPPEADFAIVGIRRRGESLARRLVPLVKQHGRAADHFGVLDITLYRDDLTTIGPNALVKGTEIDFDISGTWLVLVDDVLYTGRSVRAALSALMDLGRPQAIRFATLIDRGWRELPIHADFVGQAVETTAAQIIKVKVSEIDGVEEVELHDPGE